ncbi:MAG: hypothetical protein QGG26_14880 [Candidatus Undinarchaeales archaeon]|nr:hypothetical protein [Candidatus Undinarchaeales archaeon]
MPAKKKEIEAATEEAPAAPIKAPKKTATKTTKAAAEKNTKAKKTEEPKAVEEKVEKKTKAEEPKVAEEKVEKKTKAEEPKVVEEKVEKKTKAKKAEEPEVVEEKAGPKEEKKKAEPVEKAAVPRMEEPSAPKLVEPQPASPFPSDIKLYGRWDSAGILIEDPGLRPYINLTPILIPKSGGRHTRKQFWKSKQHIVERFINKLMGVTGHEGKHHKFSSGINAGKAAIVVNAMEDAFLIIEKKTKKNPIEVLVQAVIHAAPKCEITAVVFGGVRRPQPVDVSPQRRVDISLRFLSHGSFNNTIRKKRSFASAIANELIAAYNNDIKCYSINKKENIERQASASH